MTSTKGKILFIASILTTAGQSCPGKAPGPDFSKRPATAMLKKHDRLF